MKKAGFLLGLGIITISFLWCTIFNKDPLRSSMKLTSPAFKDGDTLPQKYTCDGGDVNPPLQWHDIPASTKSFVVIVDDPDAPQKTPWVHWILFNIPASVRSLDENVSVDTLKGAQQGLTSNKDRRFHGACPPHGHGIHHYYFKLYALDTMIQVPHGDSKEDILEAIKDHIVAQAQLMATYQRD